MASVLEKVEAQENAAEYIHASRDNEPCNGDIDPSQWWNYAMLEHGNISKENHESENNQDPTDHDQMQIVEGS